jgi:hypothetical protein
VFIKEKAENKNTRRRLDQLLHWCFLLFHQSCIHHKRELPVMTVTSKDFLLPKSLAGRFLFSSGAQTDAVPQIFKFFLKSIAFYILDAVYGFVIDDYFHVLSEFWKLQIV